MASKTFSKDFLLETLDSEKYVHHSIVDKSRWSIHYLMVFEYEGACYGTYYSVGATEVQDESPFEYAPDEIECEEYEQVEKVIKVWGIKAGSNG